jgi:hypothetical protein
MLARGPNSYGNSDADPGRYTGAHTYANPDPDPNSRWLLLFHLSEQAFLSSQWRGGERERHRARRVCLDGCEQRRLDNYPIGCQRLRERHRHLLGGEYHPRSFGHDDDCGADIHRETKGLMSIAVL